MIEVLEPIFEVFLYPLNPVNYVEDSPVFAVMVAVLVTCGLVSLARKILWSI